MKQLTTLFFLSFILTSCNVTESIVFNEQMGGTYKTSFDLSQMMSMASQGGVDTVEKEVSKAIDTTIVFNDFIELSKDSIATLSVDNQKQLYAMKGIIIEMKMDEANHIFTFAMNKPFANFDELKQVNEQLDGAMKIAETLGKGDTTVGAPQQQMDDLTKSDPIVYGFANNTFTRFQPKKEKNLDPTEGEESSETEDMTEMFKMQFEEMFEAAFYTMTYTFPKPIKSVSNKNAVLSKDRKTMTLKTNLNAINKDDTLMNLEVVLED